jgi:hypothetical protein
VLELELEHSDRPTPLPLVGLQVWRGALLMADFVLERSRSGAFRGCTALELGAGAGLVAALLAHPGAGGAARVLATDAPDDVLALLGRNARRALAGCGEVGAIAVRRLDWLALAPPADAPPPAPPTPGLSPLPELLNCALAEALPTPSPAAPAASPPADPFGWTAADAASLRAASCYFACEVCYDGALTDALFRLLSVLLAQASPHAAQTAAAAAAACPRPPRPCLYLSVEKRACFSLAELAVVHTGHGSMMAWLCPHRLREVSVAECGAWDDAELECEHCCAGGAAARAADGRGWARLSAQRVRTEGLPQRCAYERVPELELWRVLGPCRPPCAKPSEGGVQ